MTFRFLHAADIHLDSPLLGLQRYEGAPVDAIRQSTRLALKRLVDLALSERVDFVIIAGDLYDGDWRDYNTGLFFITQAQRLADAKIPLFLIAGNHDAQNLMTKALVLPANTTLLSADRPQTVRLDDLGVAIHGQSFATRAVIDDLSAAYPAGQRGLFNIGVLHTSATDGKGHEPYAPCTLEGLRSRQYHYWALGHIHQRDVLLDDPVVTFSGNIQGRHIKETGAKGCWLVSVDDQHVPQLTFHPLDVLRWDRAAVSLGDLRHEDDVWPAVENELKRIEQQHGGLPLAIRVELTGRTSLHEALHARREQVVNQIRSVGLQAGGGRIWIEKVSLHTQPPRKVPAADNEGPWDELATLLSELRDQPEKLQALGAEVIDLKGLPAEINLSTLFSDAEAAGALLDDVEALLGNRLTPSEEDA